MTITQTHKYYAFTILVLIFGIAFIANCFEDSVVGDMYSAGIAWGIGSVCIMYSAWLVIKRECL